MQQSSAFQTVECKIQNTTVLQNSRKKCMQLLCCWLKPNWAPECNETTPECEENDWEVKLRFANLQGAPRNPFARIEVRSSKTEVKVRVQVVPPNPFARNEGSIVKNWGKIASSTCPAQPFRRKRGSIVKNWGKIAISGFPLQPFRTKWRSIAKNCGKLRFFLCVQSFCVLCVKASLCKSICVKASV